MSEVDRVMPDLEETVRSRYAKGTHATAQNLCCPATYNPKLLAAIPDEVVERDYGCGDPRTICVRLKRCSTSGRVPERSALWPAKWWGPRHALLAWICATTCSNWPVATRRTSPGVRASPTCSSGREESRTWRSTWRSWSPGFRTVEDLEHLEAFVRHLRATEPMIPNDSVDVVVSNCVLNLVRPEDKQKLFCEIFRVLRRGGRAVIADIVSDEDVPEHLRADPELWSGYISGAFREDLFLEAFEQAGFYGINLLERQRDPWGTVEGIEFRSVTVVAYKGKEGRAGISNMPSSIADHSGKWKTTTGMS